MIRLILIALILFQFSAFAARRITVSSGTRNSSGYYDTGTEQVTIECHVSNSSATTQKLKIKYWEAGSDLPTAINSPNTSKTTSEFTLTTGQNVFVTWIKKADGVYGTSTAYRYENSLPSLMIFEVTDSSGGSKGYLIADCSWRYLGNDYHFLPIVVNGGKPF